MSGLSFYPNAYLDYIRFSNEMHILVEGRGDKRFFDFFLDECSNLNIIKNDIKVIRVDSAESLIGIEQAREIKGNREKVEFICDRINNFPFRYKLVGFVDREYREFERDQVLVDKLQDHNVIGRLVWSRGHSIENYIFDFDTLRGPLRAFSVTNYFQEALRLFEDIFEQTIRISCAAGLAGFELDRLQVIRSSISRDILEITSDTNHTIRILADSWINILERRLKLKEENAQSLIDKFNFWLNIVNNTDFSVVRWLCHGHIGLGFIWGSYSRCVFEICRNKGLNNKKAASEAQRVLKAEETVRFNLCADRWVQRALGNHCNFPFIVFNLLGLNFNTNNCQSG